MDLTEKALIFKGREILLQDTPEGMVLPQVPDTLCRDEFDDFRFTLNGSAYCVLEESRAAMFKDCRWVDLRQSWGLLGNKVWQAAAKGAELRHFALTTRFCAKCGSPLERATEISRRCPRCAQEYFPVLNAAIVVLVKRGEEALLVRARNFKGPFYALVAGFVETGETLEECVAREIAEETTLKVDDIHYVGSQSWPFPSQLMLGFTARWCSGEPCWSDGELIDGGFYTRDNMPAVPPGQPSLSRWIIDRWLNSEL